MHLEPAMARRSVAPSRSANLGGDVMDWYQAHRHCLGGYPVLDLLAMAGNDEVPSSGRTSQGERILDCAISTWIAELEACIRSYLPEPCGSIGGLKADTQRTMAALVEFRRQIHWNCTHSAEWQSSH
jgi:hypothetical protein